MAKCVMVIKSKMDNILLKKQHSIIPPFHYSMFEDKFNPQNLLVKS